MRPPHFHECTENVFTRAARIPMAQPGTAASLHVFSSGRRSHATAQQRETGHRFQGNKDVIIFEIIVCVDTDGGHVSIFRTLALPGLTLGSCTDILRSARAALELFVHF